MPWGCWCFNSSLVGIKNHCQCLFTVFSRSCISGKLREAWYFHSLHCTLTEPINIVLLKFFAGMDGGGKGREELW